MPGRWRTSRARYGLTTATQPHGRLRGQSIVEFALISSLLFFLLLAIIEFSRLLFVFSVVTNAAQEGSRYGIIRPRDVLSAPAATQTVQAGGPRFIPAQIVSSGGCNIVDKTRDKVWGVSPQQISVSVWYDNGSGTPIVPTTRTPAPYDTDSMTKGNRVVVETSYRFRFITPLIDRFVPSGLDVRMRSARTIVNNGDSPALPCTVSFTPAPVPTTPPTPSATATDVPFIPPTVPTGTPTQTGTATPTRTPTSTQTNTPTATPTLAPGAPTYTPVLYTATPLPPSATPTRTNTPTATPTPNKLTITRVVAKKKNGNQKPLSVEADVVDGSGRPFPQATVVTDVYVNGVLYVTAPMPWWYAGTYQECPAGTHRNKDTITVNVYASYPGYIGDSWNDVLAEEGNFTCR